MHRSAARETASRGMGSASLTGSAVQGAELLCQIPNVRTDLDLPPGRALDHLDPDQRRLHLVDAPEEAFRADAVERAGERLVERAIEAAPERQASPHVVLPHAALRLVQPE